MKIITKKSFFCVLLTILIFFSFTVNCFSENTEAGLDGLSSEYALVVNIDTNIYLYAENETDPLYCGFLPRVLTVAMMLNSGEDLNKEITITPEMIDQTPQISSANLKKGDSISLYDLCIAAVITNSQEATVALATYMGTTVEQFLATLNSKASELGCKATTFTNVHGYYRSGNINTTLADAALIIKYAVSAPGYLQIANTTYTKITVNGKPRELYTRNSTAIETNDYYISRAQAIAVSSDARIGASCANMITENDMRLISIAVTKESVGKVFKDIKLLSNFAAEEYITKTIVEKGSAVKEIQVRLGKGRDSVMLLSADAINITIPKSTPDEEIEYIYDIPENLVAPVNKGDVYGTLTVRCNGIVFATVDLTAQTSVERDMIASFTEALNGFFSNAIVWICLAVIILFIIIYTIILFYINRNKIRKQKNKKQDRVKIDIE